MSIGQKILFVIVWLLFVVFITKIVLPNFFRLQIYVHENVARLGPVMDFVKEHEGKIVQVLQIAIWVFTLLSLIVMMIYW